MEPTVPRRLPSTTAGDASAADEEIIERAKAGDERAWEEIFLAHYPSIFRFLRSRVANTEQAEDLAANAFMQAFRSIERFAWQGKPFAAWLFGIARHELAAYYRSRRVLDPLEEQHEPPARDEFLSIEIADILSRLPREYREALELRFVLGLSGIEAAAAMGRSHGSFRSLLRRASLAFRAESNPTSVSGIPLALRGDRCRSHARAGRSLPKAATLNAGMRTP